MCECVCVFTTIYVHIIHLSTTHLCVWLDYVRMSVHVRDKVIERPKYKRWTLLVSSLTSISLHIDCVNPMNTRYLYQ